jgi:hypothetical protein
MMVLVPKLVSARTAAPADALPPGRIGYDPSANTLLLHTIQTDAAFEELVSTGQLRPNASLSEPLFADAYAWMLAQMVTRLTTSGEGALWFWARIRRQDLVDLCRDARGEVLLTCRIPRERVLLSHFGDWHTVLNTSIHVPGLPGEIDDEYGARLDVIFDDFEERKKAAGVHDDRVADWPADLRTEIQQSWEHIFQPQTFGRSGTVQATAHVLYADDVVEAVRLEPRSNRQYSAGRNAGVVHAGHVCRLIRRLGPP